MRERPFQKGGLRIPFSPQGRRFASPVRFSSCPKVSHRFRNHGSRSISVPAWDYHDLVAAWWPPTGFYAEFWKLSGNKAISLSVYALRMIVDTDAKRSSCGMKDCAPHGSATRARSFKRRNHEEEVCEHSVHTHLHSWGGCDCTSTDSRRDCCNTAIRVCDQW